MYTYIVTPKIIYVIAKDKIKMCQNVIFANKNKSRGRRFQVDDHLKLDSRDTRNNKIYKPKFHFP